MEPFFRNLSGLQLQNNYELLLLKFCMWVWKCNILGLLDEMMRKSLVYFLTTWITELSYTLFLKRIWSIEYMFQLLSPHKTRKLMIFLHWVKNSLMENFILCVVLQLFEFGDSCPDIESSDLVIVVLRATRYTIFFSQ